MCGGVIENGKDDALLILTTVAELFMINALVSACVNLPKFFDACKSCRELND